LVIPTDARIGAYRVRWFFRELVGSALQSVVQEFQVIDRNQTAPSIFSAGMTDLIRRLRILLRDNDPDRNYRLRPPSREGTISQFNRVFGFIWEDYELDEYIQRSLDMISASPPRTPFASVEQLLQFRREWTTLLLTGAATFALRALMLNWIADEMDYSIGGISLSLEKSSKYESAKGNFEEEFNRQLEQAKLTVKVIRGLQQPRFGTGIRSSFGPYSGAGVLSPRKFVGFLGSSLRRDNLGALLAMVKGCPGLLPHFTVSQVLQITLSPGRGSPTVAATA
jgi:hypothetical protein